MKLLRVGAGVAAAAIALSALGGASAYGADGTPLVNESFETSTALPSGWQFTQYRPGVSSVTVVAGEGSDGAHFLQVKSPTANHARVEIPLTVAAQTTYHFHASAKASGADTSGPAAVLGVDGQTGISNSVSSDASWQPLDVYVKTGSQTSVSFMLSLGNFGHETAGTADFDGVTIAPADAVPNGAPIIALVGAGIQAAQAQTPTTTPTGGDPKNLLYPILIVVVIAAVAGGIHLMRRSDQLKDRAASASDEDDDDFDEDDVDPQDDDAPDRDEEPAASRKAGRAGPK